MTATRTDTADRLRNTDLIRIGDKWHLIEDIADAQTLAHPCRLALSVLDPAGPLAATPHVLHVYAGETVTFLPGSTHLMGHVGIRPGGVQL